MIFACSWKPGYPLNRISTQLRDTLSRAHNYTSSQYPKDPYVDWVLEVERLLRGAFTRVPLERLCTDRFWRLHEHEISRPLPLMEQERLLQVEWLEKILDTLSQMEARFADPASIIAVLDTNIFLHRKQLKEITEWPEIVGAGKVRMVVPLRVLDELDDKKAANSKRLRDRAATRLRQLGEWTLNGSGELRDGVTIEIIEYVDLDPDAYRRPAIPVDADVLETCEALASYSDPNPTYLVTGDVGTQVRAKARGISYRLMPDSSRLPLDVEAEN